MVSKTLQKPHPFIFNSGSILLPGFIVGLLIFVFAPFGFNELELVNRAILSVMFALISSLGVLIVVGLLKWLAPHFMQEERWTVGKELIIILTVIAGICLLNFVVILSIGISDMPPRKLFNFVVLYTLGISIIPVGVLVLFEQFTHQRRKLQQAQRLTRQLRVESSKKSADASSLPDQIIFEAENGNIELQLQPEEVLYINSDGNYVEIHYLDSKENTRKKLIRNRLKTFISILPDASFFRCHKSYIVNKRHIIQVQGNARNLELILRETDQRIPVSRSKSDALSDFIKDH